MLPERSIDSFCLKLTKSNNVFGLNAKINSDGVLPVVVDGELLWYMVNFWIFSTMDRFSSIPRQNLKKNFFNGTNRSFRLTIRLWMPRRSRGVFNFMIFTKCSKPISLKWRTIIRYQLSR